VLEASPLIAFAVAEFPDPPCSPGAFPDPFAPVVPFEPVCVMVSAPLGTDQTAIAAARAIDTRAYWERLETNMDFSSPINSMSRTEPTRPLPNTAVLNLLN
jgi:hypothetical protein